MTNKSLLSVMARLFLFAGVVGLAVSVGAYLGGGSPALYGVAVIGGTFWLVCAAVAFFLRSKLA